MRNIVIIGCASLGLLLASFQPLSLHQYRVKKVVIDAGHGGKDPGTLGRISQEKDIALNIALKLGQIIKENLDDVEVIYTRDGNNFVELDDRARIANKNSADVFISIHCNSSPNISVYGSESYVMGLHTSDKNWDVVKRENAVILMEDDHEKKYDGFDPNSPESEILFSLFQNAYLDNSLRLAAKVEEQFKERVGRYSRGVKQAGFLVLWKTNMPSILIEVGYLSNPKEEKDLNDDLQRTYIASGIWRAFRDYKSEIESMN
ncbi:MAG: N-acetylmuramoyl-L-alanine amidase [Cytophagales bacterium]|nr:N-acetylmuramoyl-L-alanine amidase [Cytophagales bacterium]